ATSKPYFVPITIDFYDEKQTQYTTTDYLGLKVSGDPSLNLLVSDVEPLLTPGKAARITIDLFNNGLGPAKFVQASLEADFFSLSNSSFFIGTIESDDFDTLILDGIVSSMIQPGDYPIRTTILYKNEFGDEKELVRDVMVHVYSPAEVPSANGDDGFPFWIIILILIAGGYWWFRMRKPKKMNGA
ncbi:MAG: hypothetical protein AABY11_02415, partial [archaeon]